MVIWGKLLTYQFNPVLTTLFKKALVAPAEGHTKAVARRQTSLVFQLIAPAEGHTRAVKIINTAIDVLKQQ